MIWLLSGLLDFFCSVFSFMYCWVLIFALSPFYILIYMFWRWCIDKLGVLHANQTSMCLDPNLNLGWGWRSESSLSPPVPRGYMYLFCGSFVFFVSLCFSCFWACSMLPCGHLLGRGWPLGCCWWCLLYFCYFPMWYPGSCVVLDCIFPDICHLSYFNNSPENIFVRQSIHELEFS